MRTLSLCIWVVACAAWAAETPRSDGAASLQDASVVKFTFGAPTSVAREILQLMDKQDPTIRFTTVAANPAAPEKASPNLITDPSFEAGPQADGFPVPSYFIADRYSKSEAKPVGALSVTHEIAHSGRQEYLDGISYQGGVDDPAVWNHFESQGRLRGDFESLDIHISCPVPDDPEAVGKTLFYIDDVSLQGLEEPSSTIATPLDEYYVGEAIPWTVTAQPPRAARSKSCCFPAIIDTLFTSSL